DLGLVGDGRATTHGDADVVLWLDLRRDLEARGVLKHLALVEPGLLEHRLRQRHLGVLRDSGLEGLVDEVPGQLVAHALAEHALEHLRRHLARPEAGQAGLALQLAQLGGEPRRDGLPRDLNTYAALDRTDPLNLTFHSDRKRGRSSTRPTR